MSDERLRKDPTIGDEQSPAAMLESMSNPRSYARGEDSMSTGAKIALAALCVVGLIAGWHYYNYTKLETALLAAADEYLNEHWPAASAQVDINPLTNLTSIRVERKPIRNPNLITVLEEALVESVRTELEPQLDRQLELAARAKMDLYAMALPYRVSIVVEEATGDSARRGWNQAARSAAAQGCVASILDSARRDYFQRARSVGNANPRAFPDAMVRDAFGPMCTCVANEGAKRFTLGEFERLASEPARLEAFMKEVSGPGRCDMKAAGERMMSSLR